MQWPVGSMLLTALELEQCRTAKGKWHREWGQVAGVRDRWQGGRHKRRQAARGKVAKGKQEAEVRHRQGQGKGTRDGGQAERARGGGLAPLAPTTVFSATAVGGQIEENLPLISFCTWKIIGRLS